MTKRIRWYGQKRGRTRSAEHKASTSERGYGTAWQKLRLMQLNRCPVCEECQANGRTTPGHHVDHIVPLSAGGQHELSNLQTLCASCHSRKTNRERRERAAGLPPRGIGGRES